MIQNLSRSRVQLCSCPVFSKRDIVGYERAYFHSSSEMTINARFLRPAGLCCITVTSSSSDKAIGDVWRELRSEEGGRWKGDEDLADEDGEAVDCDVDSTISTGEDSLPLYRGLGLGGNETAEILWDFVRALWVFSSCLLFGQRTALYSKLFLFESLFQQELVLMLYSVGCIWKNWRFIYIHNIGNSQYRRVVRGMDEHNGRLDSFFSDAMGLLTETMFRMNV